MTVLERVGHERSKFRTERWTTRGGGAEPWRVAFWAMPAIGLGSAVATETAAALRDQHPDLCLLAVDTAADERSLGLVRGVAKVLLCAPNHPRVALVPINAPRSQDARPLRRALEADGAVWLVDDDLRLAGGAHADLWIHARPRPSHDPLRRRLLVLSTSAGFGHAAELGYDVVLAAALAGADASAIDLPPEGAERPGTSDLLRVMDRTLLLVARPGPVDALGIILCEIA